MKPERQMIQMWEKFLPYSGREKNNLVLVLHAYYLYSSDPGREFACE